MVNKKQDQTEGKIMDAANQVFVQKGFDGARMQEIADAAGINKALLHYYYRSKEKLFMAVFRLAFKVIFPKIEAILNDPSPLDVKIRVFIKNYLQIVRKNKFIPMFVLYELQKNPERLKAMFKDIDVNDSFFFKQVKEAASKGVIKPIAPAHLVANIIGLCLFPVIARPILQQVLFKNNENDYELFLDQREEEVYNFIMQAIKP